VVDPAKASEEERSPQSGDNKVPSRTESQTEPQTAQQRSHTASFAGGGIQMNTG